MSAKVISYEIISDIDLAALAIARDAIAIRTITTRNNQRLFRAAWSVLRNHGDAEDVVQQAYLKAFTSLDRYAGNASLATWLTRITINAALDFKRSADRRRAALEAQDVSMIEDQRALQNSNADNGASPERQIMRAELARFLKAAIARLPDHFRLIFVLREIEGMSVQETADVTGLAEATIKTRLFRARRLLKKSLEPDIGALFDNTIAFAGADCTAMTYRVLKSLNLTS